MKLVRLDVRVHKKTERLIERLQKSQLRVVSVSQSRTMLRITITVDLFIENQALIELMNQRLRAEVYWIDTEILDKRYEAISKSGDYDDDAVANSYIKKIRSIPESKYKSLSEKGSPGGKFSRWQNVLYTIYHVDRVNEKDQKEND